MACGYNGEVFVLIFVRSSGRAAYTSITNPFILFITLGFSLSEGNQTPSRQRSLPSVFHHFYVALTSNTDNPGDSYRLPLKVKLTNYDTL